MCRLLGYVTRTPAALAELLGEEGIFEFSELVAAGERPDPCCQA
jgi:hypothetical protein